MSTLRVHGPARLMGRVVVPPDKSISHRALIFAALGEGVARVAPLSTGADNLATARALSQLGVSIDLDETNGYALVQGVGDPTAFSEPNAAIDCANSGTTMRLLCGVLAAAPFTTTLTGDASLCGRPMTRLLRLAAMGASLTGRTTSGRLHAPLEIRGGALVGADHKLGVASAQVKSALLLAGLFADGRTRVTEPGRSRDHTERMLRRAGVVVEEEAGGTLSVSRREHPWTLERYDIVPDFSSAAFILAAAAVTRGADLVVETGVNPTRTGFLDVLRAMGAQIERISLSQMSGEPRATLRLTRPSGERLVGTTIERLATLRAIDEIPLAAGVAAFARGETVIKDAQELRVKESNRLATTVGLLRAFGAQAEETEDGLRVQGQGPLHAAEVDAAQDHRIAMTAAIMALGVEGTTEIHGAEVIDVSFPGFRRVLSDLGARVDEGP